MGLTQEKPKTTFHPLYFLFAFIMWLLVIGWLAVIFASVLHLVLGGVFFALTPLFIGPFGSRTA